MIQNKEVQKALGKMVEEESAQMQRLLDRFEDEIEKASPWISVHERLPALGEWVLLKGRNTGNAPCEVACLHGKTWIPTNISGQPTHWMPIID